MVDYRPQRGCCCLQRPIFQTTTQMSLPLLIANVWPKATNIRSSPQMLPSMSDTRVATSAIAISTPNTNCMRPCLT